MRRWMVALPFGLLMVLAGCASPHAGAQLPVRAFTSLPPEEARRVLGERLVAEGFEVEDRFNGFAVTSHDPRFQSCGAIVIRDRFYATAKRRLSRPERTTVEAVIRVDPVGTQTQVSWKTRHFGSYLNRADNRWFDRACPGTGELERLLETALPG
jgi:hypothetical protein